MMRKIMLCIALLGISGWANAAETVPETAAVQISAKDCKRLIRLVGGAAYQPGVDVRGKKVKPANVGGGATFQLPEEFSFEIGLDLAAKYGLAAKNIAAEMITGKVTVKGGQVYMNGKPMTTKDQAGLAAKCQDFQKLPLGE